MDDHLFHNTLNQKRTEEVADIIEKMPSRFGFFVSTIVILLIVSSFFFGWIIKYPDTLIGEISLTGRNAPVKLVAFSTGKIKLLNINSGVLVKANEHIALIQNSAAYDDIVLLDSLLQHCNLNDISSKKYKTLFPKNISVGELSAKYFSFYNSLLQYIDYKEQQPFEKQIHLGEQFYESKNNLSYQNREEKIRLTQKYELAKKLNLRDSLLVEKKIIGTADLERSKLNTIGSEQELKYINREMTNNDYLINEANTRLSLLSIQKQDKERELEVILYNAYFGLLEGIEEWQKKYLLQSPISGVLDFMNFNKDEDFVQQGQELFSVIPNKNEIIGQIYLPDLGAGKVKIGQEVIVKLNNYPYIQYGAIHGKVKRISLVSNQQITGGKNNIGVYLVHVDFPKGLTTNYGSQLNFQFDMHGIAEIITDDRRLIERLFDNLKYRIK